MALGADLVAGPVRGRALVDAAAALAGRAPAPGPGHAPGRRAGGPAQGTNFLSCFSCV